MKVKHECRCFRSAAERIRLGFIRVHQRIRRDELSQRVDVFFVLPVFQKNNHYCFVAVKDTDNEDQNFDVKQGAFTISSIHFDTIGVSLRLLAPLAVEAQTGDTHAVCHSLPQLLQVAGRFFLPSVLQFEIRSFSYER